MTLAELIDIIYAERFLPNEALFLKVITAASNSELGQKKVNTNFSFALILMYNFVRLNYTSCIEALQSSGVLMELGVDLSAAIQLTATQCTTLALTAAHHNAPAALQKLSESGVDLSARIHITDTQWSTAAIQAAHHNAPAALQKLSESGVDLSARIQVTDTQWTTAAVQAACSNAPDALQKLFELGVDLNARIQLSDTEWTFVASQAAYQNAPAALQKLFELGVDLSARIRITDIEWTTAALQAAYYNASDALQKLSELGVDLSARIRISDTQWTTAAVQAACSNAPAALQKLFELGVDLSARIQLTATETMTAALMAAHHNAPAALQKLFELGVDLRARVQVTANWDCSPALLAAMNNHHKALNFLLEKYPLLEAGLEARFFSYKSTPQFAAMMYRFIFQQRTRISLPHQLVQSEEVSEYIALFNELWELLGGLSSIYNMANKQLAGPPLHEDVRRIIADGVVMTKLSRGLTGEQLAKTLGQVRADMVDASADMSQLVVIERLMIYYLWTLSTKKIMQGFANGAVEFKKIGDLIARNVQAQYGRNYINAEQRQAIYNEALELMGRLGWQSFNGLNFDELFELPEGEAIPPQARVYRRITELQGEQEAGYSYDPVQFSFASSLYNYWLSAKRVGMEERSDPRIRLNRLELIIHLIKLYSIPLPEKTAAGDIILPDWTRELASFAELNYQTMSKFMSRIATAQVQQLTIE